MAREVLFGGLPCRAASIVLPHQAVEVAPGDTDYLVRPLTGATTEPIGVAGDATAGIGEALTVYSDGNIVKLTAAASLGAGTDIGVVGATSSYGLAAAASGSAKFRVGRSLTAGAAGEQFAAQIRPRQLSGLA